ncbi:hypothetical protein AB6813_04045 [bacterium RCC_150]
MTLPTSARLEPVPAKFEDSPDRWRWLWLAVPAVAGLVLGLAWWILAPGGLNLVSGNPGLADPGAVAGRLPRDLVLAGLLLLAGCLTAVLLDAKISNPGQGIRVLLAVVGGLSGSFVAWQAGLLAAHLWGPAATGGNEGFTLRAMAVLLLWPGATALVSFLLTLFGLMGKQQEARPTAP